MINRKKNSLGTMKFPLFLEKTTTKKPEYYHHGQSLRCNDKGHLSKISSEIVDYIKRVSRKA